MSFPKIASKGNTGPLPLPPLNMALPGPRKVNLLHFRGKGGEGGMFYVSKTKCLKNLCLMAKKAFKKKKVIKKLFSAPRAIVSPPPRRPLYTSSLK